MDDATSATAAQRNGESGAGTSGETRLGSGVACVRALARHRAIGTESARDAATHAADAREAPALVELAGRVGLPLAVDRIGPGDLRELGLPVIARGEDGEFFLIEALRDDGVLIAEPHRDAQTLLSHEQFTMRWSGVVLRDAPAGGTRAIDAPGAYPNVAAGGRRHDAWLIVGAIVLTLLGALAWWASTRVVETTVWGTAVVPHAPQGTPITASSEGKLRRVRFQDGDSVAEGDVLLELTIAEIQRVEADPDALLEAELELARADAMLASISLDAPPRLRGLAGVNATRRASEERALAARYEDYRARIGAFDGAIEKAGAQRRATEETVASLQEGLALARKRAAESQSLFDQGFISRNALHEREERVVQLQRDLEKQTASVAEAAKGLVDATDARRALVADTRKSIEAERVDAQQQLSALRAASSKSLHAERVLEVKADRSGVGRMAERLREGDAIRAGQVVAIVQPQQRLAELVAMVDEAYPGQIKTGMNATLLRTGGAATVTARIVALAEEAGAGATAPGAPRRVQATLRVDRAQQAGDVLEPGVQVMVRVAVGTRSLLASWFAP